MDPPGPRRPGRGAVDRLAQDGKRRRQRRADVKRHLNVGAEALLHRDRVLGRQAVERTVVGGPKGHAVVIDIRIEAEHLEPARVREQMSVPRREAMQAPHLGDDVRAWTEHQVIRVGQRDLDAEPVEISRAQGADSTARAYRHEAGCLVRAARGGHRSTPRRTVRRRNVETDGQPSFFLRARSMASPNERKRYSSSSARW